MADTRRVDMALQPRPALPEVVGVVLACALVFLALVKIDGSAARDEAQRARAALAERAAAEPVTALPIEETWGRGLEPLPAPKAEPAATTAAGGPPTTLLALIAGVGVMMALTGTALLTRR